MKSLSVKLLRLVTLVMAGCLINACGNSDATQQEKKMINNANSSNFINNSNTQKDEDVKAAFIKEVTAPIPDNMKGDALAKEFTVRSERLENLLQKGAPVNEKVDENNNTALMYASALGNTTAVKVLLKHHADPNITDSFGQTALMLASVSGYTEIVQALLQAGANVNAADRFGRSALMTASEEGHIETVKALLKAGADVNANFRSWTSLMLASKAGHTEIVHALLQAGADVNMKDRDQKTALTIASQAGHTGIVALLKSYGAKE